MEADRGAVGLVDDDGLVVVLGEDVAAGGGPQGALIDVGLEAQAGVATRLPAAVPADAAPPDPSQPKAGTLTTPRRKRRAYTPNFMRD